MENNFIIRCLKCRWAQLTTGLPDDLKGLYEVANSCSKCGKPREFRCPKCGRNSKMTRIRGGGHTATEQKNPE